MKSLMRLSSLGVLTGSGDNARSLRAEVLRLVFGEVKGSLAVCKPWELADSSLCRYLFLILSIKSSFFSSFIGFLGKRASEVLKFRDVILILGLVMLAL